MTRRVLWTIVFAVVAWHVRPAAGSAAGQLGHATAHVVVTRSDGSAPEPLGIERFTVRSDGEIVPVVRAAAAGPLSVVLLVDVTRTMSENMAPLAWDGQRGEFEQGVGVNPSGVKPPDSPSELFLTPILRGFLANLGPHDRARIGRIAHVPDLGPDLTADRGALASAARRALGVSDTDRHGRTPIWDAVDMAVAALEHEPGRRAVIVFTDGLATGNARSLDAVIERATLADVSVFVIGETTGRLRSGRGWSMRDSTNAPWIRMWGVFGTPPEENLQRLARSTGGVFIADGFQSDPNPARHLRTAVSLLHSTYTLTFHSPRPAGEIGRLTVDPIAPGIEVHVRERYRVGSR